MKEKTINNNNSFEFLRFKKMIKIKYYKNCKVGSEI